MTEYDAVLFDNDGVLVEPPAPETQRAAARSAFAAVGVDDPDPEYVETIVGGVTPDALRGVAAHHGLDPATLRAARERHDERSQIEAFRTGVYDDVPDLHAVTDLL